MRFSHFWTNFDYPRTADDLTPWNAFLFGKLMKPDVHIGSVFGHSPTPFDLLFSGELVKSLRHDGQHFVFLDHHTGREGRAKWFMGTPRIDHPQALWLPLFYCYWAKYRAVRWEQRPESTEKQFGVSVVVRNLNHGTLARRRAGLAHELSRFVPVHANRELMTVAPADSKVIYHDVPDKLWFLERFTHNLCFENNSHLGYLTEKLFDALYAGAVPLYAGDPLASEWFGTEGFLDCSQMTAESIARAMCEDRAMPALVSREREKICRVSFEEMQARVENFASRIHETRQRPI